MTTPAHNANGHRRRELRNRVLAEETQCGICDQPVDKSLGYTDQHGPRCTNPDCMGCVPHPMRAEVDEIVPRVQGGSPLARDNVMLTHRRCNRLKWHHSLEWARAKVHGLPEATPTTITNLLTW